MKNVLISGSTGGIGAHLSSALSDCRIFTVSRQASLDSLVYPCDLSAETPRLKDTSYSIDWIVHLATSYKTADDLAMLQHLLEFAREHHVKNFLYASSWVVHFPAKPIKQEYVTMKRACEQELDQARSWLNVYIVRPSVVLGDRLLWDKVLRKLAPFYPLIPGNFTRSFVDVNVVTGAIKGIIDGQAESKAITVLGQRHSLREMARRHSSHQGVGKLWLAGGILLAVVFASLIVGFHSRLAEGILLGLLGAWLLSALALKYLIPEIHEYFAGFKYYRFYPETEDEVISLCHAGNNNVVIKGYDNKAKYYHEKSPAQYTHVVLEHFNRVRSLDLENQIVCVEAGICFADLLAFLTRHNRWLANYPNYHYITAGACILCPVHGSSIQYPFIADLVQSFRYYDRRRDEIIELSRNDKEFDAITFNSELINQIVVLTVDLRISNRVRYRLETEKLSMNELNFGRLFESLDHDKHLEVRVNSLRNGHAYVQTYSAIDYSPGGSSEPKGLQAIKADAIGRKWNLMRRNFVTSVTTQVFSRPYVNFEWFFTRDEFKRFWDEIVAQKQTYRFFKLLIRFNAASTPTSNPYYNTVSVDVSMLNTPEMLRRSRKLYDCYKPLEHSGKFRIETLSLR